MSSAAWSETQPIPVGHSSRDNHLRPFSFPTQVCSVYLLPDCFPNCINVDHMTNGGGGGGGVWLKGGNRQDMLVTRVTKTVQFKFYLQKTKTINLKEELGPVRSEFDLQWWSKRFTGRQCNTLRSNTGRSSHAQSSIDTSYLRMEDVNYPQPSP